ncbi:MAG: restriction endonuclease subunit S [bacterium]|nr:restriction endonuclease subunit S [bacterium]
MSKLLERINKKHYLIGEICAVSGGGTPSTTVQEYWNGDIPWLTPTEVSNVDFCFVSDTKRKITKKGLESSSARLMPVNSILMSSRANIGDVVINKIPMSTNQGFINIIPKPDLVDLYYFSYWLRSRKNYFIQISTGSTFLELSKSNFKEIQIDLPNLPTQKKIAEILSAYDSKIENNNKIIKNLELTAQTIFNEWFVRFRFPGFEKVKMVKSEMGEIPEGWSALKLKDIFTFIKGKKPSETSEIQKENYLQQILIDSFENGNKLYAGKHGMVVSSEEDLLMVMDGASSGRIEFGITGIVGSTMSRLQLCRPVRSILYFYLKSKERDIKDNTSGSAIPHTDKEKVYGYEIALPKNTNIYEEKLFGFISGVKKLNQENIFLKQSRDQLLAKLI